MKRIGILGGSFNPPHIGHVAIARFVLKRHLADEVWVVPCADHPDRKQLAPFDDRLAMCQLAFQGISNVIVNDVESKLQQPSYTVQTLRHLLQNFPDKLFLIVGSDIIGTIPQWKEGAKIRKLAPLIEVPRGPHSPIPDVNATEIRRLVHDGNTITGQVPAPVATYIQSHHLYR